MLGLGDSLLIEIDGRNGIATRVSDFSPWFAGRKCERFSAQGRGGFAGILFCLVLGAPA
jgi:hypothetical protein